MDAKRREYLENQHCVTFDDAGHPIDFGMPMQVMFLDTNADKPFWIGGIAFNDYIICGCCGGVVFLKEFWEDVTDYWQCG